MNWGNTEMLRPRGSPPSLNRNRRIGVPQMASLAGKRCGGRSTGHLSFALIPPDHVVVDPVPVAIDAGHPRRNVDIFLSLPTVRL